MTLQPETIEELQATVRAHPRVLARGGGTKPALSSPPAGAAQAVVEVSGLSGVLEYEPQEYTFTALAGTPVREVEAVLAEHGQYLPFDPLFVERGATLGGTVAAGTNGPGRYRYGGVRDFLLGVQYVDSGGGLVRGGGKVVKNAAGFDIPKLMVGSLGQYGVLVELTFKVFPEPPHYATLKVAHDSLDAALDNVMRLGMSPLALHALEVEPPGTLWLRLGGLESALPARVATMRDFLGGGDAVGREEADEVWRAAREMAWVPAGASLARVPLTPKRIPMLDERLAAHPSRQRYGVGGNVAWLAWQASVDALDTLLQKMGLTGLLLRGEATHPLLGRSLDNVFAQRVKTALNPAGRFVEFVTPE